MERDERRNRLSVVVCDGVSGNGIVFDVPAIPLLLVEASLPCCPRTEVDVDSSRELGRCATRSSLDEAAPRTAFEEANVLVMSMVGRGYRQSCMVVQGVVSL